MANILLVATGGTRASTQIELSERFRADGHAVRMLASGNALRFLSAYLARRPTKIINFLRSYRPALQETFAYFRERPKCVPHIAEGKWADIAVMAPATCNSIGKLVAGISDNYALLVLRAIPRNKRVVVVPSMNPEMWFDPFLQRNIDLLNETEKYRVLSPTRGEMLCGDWGFGAQVPLNKIVDETYRLLGILGRDAGTSADTPPVARFLHIDPDSELRASLATALRSAYPQVEIVEFANAGPALDWLRFNPVACILTELDFSKGPSGIDLVHQLRRTGSGDLQIIATSARKRGVVGAEELARLDVHFVPKPLNLLFIVGLITGTLQLNARHQSALGVRKLEPGEVLFRQGDRGSEAFIVRRGRLQITREESDMTLDVGTAGPGEMIGEMAFLNQTTRSATLTAMEPTELAVLNLEYFRDYLDRQPEWFHTMLQSMIGHVSETTTKLAQAERRASDHLERVDGGNEVA